MIIELENGELRNCCSHCGRDDRDGMDFYFVGSEYLCQDCADEEFEKKEV